MSAWTVRRWASQATSGFGCELGPAPVSLRSLTQALGSAALRTELDVAFVIVRLRACDEESLRRTIDAANSASMKPRLCLAVDRDGLERIDAAAISSDRIGIMLDDVDADTPLSLVASRSIEAIRFRPDFIARSTRDLRLSCVLESMLLLAHNLGICTMGPSLRGDDDSISPVPTFDYVPAPAAASSLPENSRPRLAFAEGSVIASTLND